MQAKIGGVGSYAPLKGQRGGEPVMFNLTITLATRRPIVTPVQHASGHTIDIESDHPAELLPALTTVESGLGSPPEPVVDEDDGEFDEEV